MALDMLMYTSSLARNENLDRMLPRTRSDFHFTGDSAMEESSCEQWEEGTTEKIYMHI